MNSRLRLALLATLACHAALALTGRYRLSYDAYTHMFLGDHYLRQWGSLWEPRWYAGFSVTSYPPLVHQLIGLLGHLTGVDAAFAVLLVCVSTGLTLAVYGFGRIFLDEDGAGYAALGAAVLPAIYLAAYTFGQLPTLTATLFALSGMAALARFLKEGGRISGGLAVACIAAAAASHHGTLLFLPLGGLAVALHLALNRQVAWPRLLGRLALAGFPMAAAALLVVWPFWQWGLGQVLQTPIDHLSRHDFLSDPAASVLFFWPVYGLLLLLVPLALWGLVRRATAAPAGLFAVLFLLGLGGTTPLPRWIFGADWAWLTYDRFALWASLVLLVFFGRFAVWARGWLERRNGLMIKPLRVDWLGPRAWLRRPAEWISVKLAALSLRKAIPAAAFSILAACALAVALLPTMLPTQPPPLDLRPIAAFLDSGEAAQWRYLTFGLGDQFAALSLLTRAGTIDGSYHTARSLPVLRDSGVGQIDSVFWSSKGLGALDPILQAASEYGVRWGFVDRAEYAPVLARNGWQLDGALEDGVQVWENPQAVLPPVSEPPPDNPLALLSWQTLPLASLALAGTLAAAMFRPAETSRVLRGVHSLAVGLLPLGVSFWYYTDLAAIDHPRVYLTYSHILLYASDGLAMLALAAWGLSRWIEPRLNRKSPRVVAWLTRLLLALCSLSTLSAAWSVDWRVSLYFSAQLWLLFGLYLSLKDNPLSARMAVWGASAALLLQAGIGFVQFAAQSTAFLAPLGLNWPGALTPELRGVSVVQLANGARWLRVYGTLPHPNMLGGLALVLLVGPAAWFLNGRRWRWAAGLAVMAGMALLALTFSRSAWLGCLAAAGVLVFHLRTFLRWRLATLAAVMALGPLAVLPTISPLVLTRFTGQAVPTEQESVLDRAWMIQQSLGMIRDRPLLGVGAGGFEASLASRAPGSFNIEPIHDLPLLVTSELGLPGALIGGGLVVVVIIGALRARRPGVILLSAALAGLGLVSLFDHYLWSLAPGRTLLWGLLGLWAGWYSQKDPTPNPSPNRGGEKKITEFWLFDAHLGVKQPKFRIFSPFPKGRGPGGWVL